jgi:hypothetical protein
MEYTKEEKAYIDSLSEKERQAHKIAVSFLKTSFDLKKSLGYMNYLKKSKQINTNKVNTNKS